MKTGSEVVLPRIPYLRLRITLRALRRATLPAYKGSMLRGAFGHSLRTAVCVIGPDQPCETCLLRPSCYYTKLFEPFAEGPPPAFLRGLPITPRPYVFEPGRFDPGQDARHLDPGDPLEFDLLLFGQATDLQLYALLAVERMAACGLGRNRAPFRFERALARAPDGTWKAVLEEGRMRGRGSTRPSFPSGSGLDGPRAVLRFLTPTRLRVEDHRVETASFPELVDAMLGRVMEVVHFHVPGAVLAESYEPLLEKAREVRIVSSSLRWHDWERYNARQKTLMNMGGFMGSIEVEGDLTPFVPLLRAAEIIHVGRGTPFGLGRLAVETAAP